MSAMRSDQIGTFDLVRFIKLGVHVHESSGLFWGSNDSSPSIQILHCLGDKFLSLV